MPPMFVRVSKIPRLAARLPSGAQLLEIHVLLEVSIRSSQKDGKTHIFPPVQRKHAVAMRNVPKYFTAVETGERRMAYPIMPKGAQIISGKNRAVYLSDRIAPTAYTSAPQRLTGITRYCACTVENWKPSLMMMGRKVPKPKSNVSFYN